MTPHRTPAELGIELQQQQRVANSIFSSSPLQLSSAAGEIENGIDLKHGDDEIDYSEIGYGEIGSFHGKIRTLGQFHHLLYFVIVVALSCAVLGDAEPCSSRLCWVMPGLGLFGCGQLILIG
ncbi:hypothetical protein Dimus_028500 [Dionaea muscipula]